MKIDNPLSPQVSTGATGQTGAIAPSQGGATGRSRVDGSSDQVQLSNLSAAVRHLQSAALGDLESEDPARTAQVQKVGAAVADGSYKIDPAQLGRSILSDSLEIR